MCMDPRVTTSLFPRRLPLWPFFRGCVLFHQRSTRNPCSKAGVVLVMFRERACHVICRKRGGKEVVVEVEYMQ